MIKFSLNQIKFFSATTIALFSWQSIAIAGSNIELKIKSKKAPLTIAQMIAQQDQDVLVPNPTIKIDGKPISGQQTPPPFLPRAVAPPVGDMSVSNVGNNVPSINLGTTALVPRLVLRDAPATEVLALLTRAAGLNIIFTESGGIDQVAATVSLDLENEPIQDVFDSVLLISGLKANRQGNTVFIGDKLPPTVKTTITRSIRLNQYSAIGAATFLNSQGAKGNIVEVDDDEETGRRTFTVKPLDSAAKDNEYLILEGLTIHADPLNDTITLVGEPHLIQTATSFLTQLDVRRRQVAVNVKIVDIALGQNENFGTSFSFGINDTGVVQDGGLGVINFGTNDGNINPIIPNSGRRTPLGTNADPTQPSVTGGVVNPEIPGFNVPNAFLAQIRANISSGNAKILTDPTLVVQEGQVGSLELVENVVTSITTEIDTESGVRTVTPEIEPAGLILNLAINKIDDNGFISLQVNPSVSFPGEITQFDSGGAVNFIQPLVERNVTSGLIRLRDGQTLILSGIITDNERSVVSKVPILGDLPLIGALFRSTSVDRDRSEVVVILTPQILDDTDATSGFGYNYNPSRETGEYLRDRGLNIPTKPY